MLGAVLARHVEDLTAHGTAVPAYGDATGRIFLVCAAVAALGILAAVLLKPVTLRTSLDKPDVSRAVAVATEAADGVAPLDQTPFPQEPAGPGAPPRDSRAR
ncbi:hypothetical protein [Nonomuraea composti]|uniref:hypothetical protein n=1 Tax=Nonomuraea composti TaxID=2720023 RepID=UPI0019807F46|nr:hypothetical protein [Nonomuraea sp. FMUSA5-5]